MAYIKTNINQPGIIELLFYKAGTGKALSNLAHTLLHGKSTLSKAERELIASYVSYLNKCEFCYNSHSAAADEHFNEEGITQNYITNNKIINPKMQALLNIAAKVQISGKAVTLDLIEVAREANATDEEIHDTVLIAAAFCMYNRYVDGMGTGLPQSKTDYKEMGYRLAKKGYKYPALLLRQFIIKLINKRAKNLVRV